MTGESPGRAMLPSLRHSTQTKAWAIVDMRQMDVLTHMVQHRILRLLHRHCYFIRKPTLDIRFIRHPCLLISYLQVDLEIASHVELAAELRPPLLQNDDDCAIDKSPLRLLAMLVFAMLTMLVTLSL